MDKIAELCTLLEAGSQNKNTDVLHKNVNNNTLNLSLVAWSTPDKVATVHAADNTGPPRTKLFRALALFEQECSSR